MSEKRFHQFGLWVIDNPNFNGISIADLVDTELMSITEVVDLLNEQQTDLNYLAKFIGEFKVDEFKEKLRTLRTLEDKVDEQQATIDMQELRLQQLEELLELSENLNKSYREKLIDMNLKMVIDDE